MDSGVATLAAIPFVVFFLVLSLVKTSLRSVSKVTLRQLAETSRGTTRRLLEQFLSNPTEFILLIQSLIQVSLITIVVLGTTAIVGSGVVHPLPVALLGLGAFVLGFEHFFPRYVLSVDREKLLSRLLPAYALLEPVARVIAWPASALYRKVFKARPGATATGEVSVEAVRAFIDVGEEAGIFDEAEGEIIESIVDLSETLVREVMTPRVDIVSIDALRTVAEARDTILESMHSRIPVYRERPDNIEGVVYLKDLLEAWRDGKEGEKVAVWMKPTSFVPETKSVSNLLKEFQRTHVTFAIVVDEFGGNSGLVTISDLIEEIVGEIKEDYDDGPAEIVEQPDGSYLLSGKVNVDKLTELFGLELGEVDYDTVAGLVFVTLGRLPTPGEEFTHAGLLFKVVDADRHRINQVRVTPLSASSRGTAGAARSAASGEGAA